MTKQQMLNMIDELLEFPPGTLKGDEKLSSLEEWDSMAVLGFMAMVDEKIGVNIEASKIAESETIHDLIAMLESK